MVAILAEWEIRAKEDDSKKASASFNIFSLFCWPKIQLPFVSFLLRAGPHLHCLCLFNLKIFRSFYLFGSVSSFLCRLRRLSLSYLSSSFNIHSSVFTNLSFFLPLSLPASVSSCLCLFLPSSLLPPATASFYLLYVSVSSCFSLFLSLYLSASPSSCLFLSCLCLFLPLFFCLCLFHSVLLCTSSSIVNLIFMPFTTYISFRLFLPKTSCLFRFFCSVQFSSFPFFTISFCFPASLRHWWYSFFPPMSPPFNI